MFSISSMNTVTRKNQLAKFNFFGIQIKFRVPNSNNYLEEIVSVGFYKNIYG